VNPYPVEEPRNRRGYVREFGVAETACTYPHVAATEQICGISVAVRVKQGKVVMHLSLEIAVELRDDAHQLRRAAGELLRIFSNAEARERS
jgi:hypothetical protein